MAREWGPWQLSDDGRRLERDRDSAAYYYVDLVTCDSPAQVLDWICQIAGRYRADDAAIAGLVRAFDDLLWPQANLCGEGKPKKLSGRKLRALLERRGRGTRLSGMA